MLSLVLYSVAAVAVAGLILKWILERFEHSRRYRITRLEYIVEIILMGIIIAPLTAWIGIQVARQNLLTFNEYWNGWELQAVRTDIHCERDGRCVHEYNCDPYVVMVSYSCGTDGKNTRYRPETRYHSCPYVTTESTFTIETTLGLYTIASHRFPENPNQSRWRAGKNVSDSVIKRAGTGIPEFWQAAKNRIDAGKPGPVQKRMSYKNYLLASDQTILKQYSSSIERYRERSLLPAVAGTVYDFYQADKVHFVGYTPKDPMVWQQSLSYLVAALGNELQGDLQLVIVNDMEVDKNPDEYAFALKAYWQDPESFGRDTLSKNGIVIVVGTTNNTTVSWARAFTGMPLGNESLLVALRSELRGVLLTPEALIGTIRGEFYSGKPSVLSVRSDGVISQLLWGEIDPATKFTRISMTANDLTDNGSGFLYLSSEIQPTEHQRIVIIICIFILGLFAWWVCAVVDGDAMLVQMMSRNKRRW